MQIYSGTRLSSTIHRRPLSRFFPEGGGDICTQAMCIANHSEDQDEQAS